MSAHICLWTDSREPSGMGVLMTTLAAALRDRYQLSLLCPPTEGGAALLRRAATLNIATYSPPDAAALRDWLYTHQPDLFHVHAGIGWEGHGGVYAAREAKIAAVVRTEHLPFLLTDSAQRNAYFATLPLIDRLVCVSAGVRRSHIAAGVPAEQTVVVLNGIAPPPPAPDRAITRAQLGWAADESIMLTVGRFTEQKHHRLLLHALSLLVSQYQQVRCAWVGSGPQADQLRAEAAALGVADHVQWLGQRHDVAALMAAADLFVLPSRFEGLPLVVLEAMAAGLPVVGTAVCGIADAIETGVTGWLVPADDAAALAQTIAWALTNPAAVEQVRSAAEQRSRTQWSAQRMADDMAQVYDSLLNDEG